tara:strand:- start:275 stop:493 length:219 start_codon:yes stop_codon:yes gene_type:complete
LTFIDFSIAVVIFEITTLLAGVSRCAVNYLLVYAEAPALTALILASESALVDASVAVVIFTIARLVFTWPAR